MTGSFCVAQDRPGKSFCQFIEYWDCRSVHHTQLPQTFYQILQVQLPCFPLITTVILLVLLVMM